MKTKPDARKKKIQSNQRLLLDQLQQTETTVFVQRYHHFVHLIVNMSKCLYPYKSTLGNAMYFCTLYNFIINANNIYY